MKTLCLSLVFAFGVLLSKQIHNSQIKPVPPIDSVLIRLKNKKAFVDQYIIKHSDALIVFVKVPGRKDLVMVKNDKWPDEIEYTYNILKNPAGEIIFVAQIPYSESGDWDIEYKHYFDDQGNTYAFFKQESIFDDNVKGGIVRNMFLSYYDKKFKSISQINELTDKDFKPIKNSKNSYDFRDYKYSIYKNLSECLKGYNIQLTN